MRPIDPRRLARAVHLDVHRLGLHQWEVSGGKEPHQVWREPAGLLCDCTDAGHGRKCKHMLAVRLSLGEEVVRLALRELVALPPKAEKRKGATGSASSRSGPRGRS